MTKRRRIIYADKILQNVIHVFCLLMFLQLKDYYTVASNPMLLYSTASDIRVADTSKIGKVKTIVDGLEQGSAVDYLLQKDLVCWWDQSADSIQCMAYNGTHSGDKVRILKGHIAPSGIAIDWYTDKIYWTDGDTNRIEVISIEQRFRKVLFWTEVDLVRAITVVPKEGLVFWTDWGEVPKIERAGMNGDPSTRRVIIKDDIVWPNGITVDYNENLIYWVDAKLHFVDVINFEGQNRKRIVDGGLEYPYALTFFNDKLYWTDWKSWAIYTWDMSKHGPIENLTKSDPVPVDIKVYDALRQLPPTGDYPCKVKNGGCSHLCLLSPKEPGYSCNCPTGLKLKENSNTTCYNAPQALLLIAQRTVITKISLDSPDFTPTPIPLKDLKRALAVDYDPKTEYMYWADSVAKTISRARLDGSEQAVVVRSDGAPDSVAVDPIARNVYWTDPVADTISVARLDGTSRKVIIHEELYEPRAIALYPTAGWMFWSDWNDKKPKIERANLDGTNRILLVSEKVTWPNGMALDMVNNKLYWGDARTHKIEVCNMDGSDRKEIHSRDIMHIFGMTILGDHLYWTDMQKRTLDRINKNTGEDRVLVVEQMANMLGVKAVRARDSGTSGTGGTGDSGTSGTLGAPRCAGRGGCSHLCFNRPNDYVCSCPLGLELGADRKTCVEPEAFLVYSRKNIIGRISVENTDNDAILPLKELREVSALAVHVSGNKIYWSDSKTKTINRCSANGSNMEKIVEGLGVVEGLAIDWAGQNIYWTDSYLQRVEAARLDGSSRRALLCQGLKKPKSIVLDPRRGYMYWSDIGSRRIKRAGMDGSAPSTFMDQAGLVHALAIDYDKRAIYWASVEPSTIEFAYLNGTGRRTLTDNILVPYAMTLYNDTVFWAVWTTGQVEVAKKTDGSNRRTIHTKLDMMSDLKVFHRSKAAGGNQCSVDNGGCGHLCLAVPSDTRTDYRCACPNHYRLNSDNLTCSGPEEFLLYAQKNSIGRVAGGGGGECPDAALPLSGLRSVRAIDYDPFNKLFYWMDDESHSIRRVPIGYSATSVADATAIVTDLSRPFHMVLDTVGRTIYWTCADTDSINATTMDTNSTAGVVVRGINMAPRHLGFHQTKRYLIWNDVSLGSIMRANVDGSSRLALAAAANATALAVAQAGAGASAVYWAVGRQIHAVDIDGRNRRVVWQGGVVSSLALLGTYVYAVAGGAGGERALVRVPLHRRDAPAAPAAHVTRLTALKEVTQPPTTHPCFGGRACGGGAAACGAGGRCGCGLRCAASAACRPTHYTCGGAAADGEPQEPRCIPQEWRCDGQLDCQDGSDEATCGACLGGVRCADGACGASLADCPAGAHCPPAAAAALPDAFRCDERLCLSVTLLCDGRAHCEDGADETPAACAYHAKDKVSSPSAGRSHWAAISLSIGCAVLALAVCWAACRRWRGPRRPPRALPLCAPLKPLDPHARRDYMRPMCDEDARTLASDSLCERYPHPTANPPPSPATASGGGGGGGGGGGRRRAYRHYRAMNRPPPPTPASTDACESEPEPGAPPPSPACLTLSY